MNVLTRKPLFDAPVAAREFGRGTYIPADLPKWAAAVAATAVAVRGEVTPPPNWEGVVYSEEVELFVARVAPHGYKVYRFAPNFVRCSAEEYAETGAVTDWRFLGSTTFPFVAAEALFVSPGQAQAIRNLKRAFAAERLLLQSEVSPYADTWEPPTDLFARRQAARAPGRAWAQSVAVAEGDPMVAWPDVAVMLTADTALLPVDGPYPEEVDVTNVGWLFTPGETFGSFFPGYGGWLLTEPFETPDGHTMPGKLGLTVPGALGCRWV